MTPEQTSRRADGPSLQKAWIVLILLAVVLGAYLRLEGLGERSLWRDELCTWRVSRMDLAESMRWGPELTKPPLYQLALRVLTRDPHPSEAMLRLPAAACGLLVVVVGWWLGRLGGGRWVGAAMALLCALNGLQIYYSQEARPYSMLLLGCMLTTGLWYHLVIGGRWRFFLAYVVVAVLTLHAHYLAALTLAGHALWWLIFARTNPSKRRGPWLRPFGALVATGILCMPIVVRYLYFRSSMFQGLSWIDPPTVLGTLDVLGRLTFGLQWVFVVLMPALALWIASASGVTLPDTPQPGGRVFGGRVDFCGLLLACFATGWFGLLVISWIAHPAMIARYALPASVPAILIPLILAHRLDRRMPLIIVAVFALASAPEWITRGYASQEPPQWRSDPGLRELAAYLTEHADPTNEVVVLTLDATIYPEWEDSERLVFDYYPIEGVPIEELRLGPDNITAENDILKDPRGLYLIVLWADEMAIVEAAGRQIVPFEIEDRSFDRLLFTPYRLVHIAPLEDGNTAPGSD
jgi:hypothetical protein